MWIAALIINLALIMKARTRGALAVVFLFMGGGGVVVPDVGAEIEDLFDQELYSTLQARTIDDAQDLIDFYIVERSGFLPILPPGDGEHVQPVAPIPANLPDLPDGLLNGLLGEEIAPAVVGYRVYLAEEISASGRRRWLVMNADSEVLWAEWAPTGYDPMEELALLHPDLVAAAERGDPEAAAKWDALKLWRDPARLILAVYIVAADDLIDYVWAESLARDDEASSATLGALGGMIMSSGPYTSNDLWLAINGVTNGCTGTTADLTIHTPAGNTNSSYDVFYAPALASATDWQFLMRCPTNIIAQTNVFARYLCEEQGYFGIMEVTTNCDLIVMTNITAQAMAEMLVPPWVIVANATNIGAVVTRGAFTNGNCCGLPIDSGVILSSGDILNALGTNDHDGWDIGDVGGFPDLHLNLLVDDEDSDEETDDAAVLEFDVVSTNSCALSFRYIYASEEYPEYTGNIYTDPLGIFITTNRTGGEWEIYATNNIALIPGGVNVPVSVNTVHGGGGLWPSTASPTNALYYVDNHDPYHSSVPPYATGESVFSIQYDGMTVLLLAHTSIAANVTNHVKIAIADYRDNTHDSAIFLKAWLPNPCE